MAAARLPEDPHHHHGVALAEVFAATKPRGQAAVVLSYLTASTDSSSYQILDEQGTVVGCSDGWLRIIGYTAAEALGSKLAPPPRPAHELPRGAEGRGGHAPRRARRVAPQLLPEGRFDLRERLHRAIPLRASNDNLFYVSIHERDPPLDWSLADAQPPSDVKLHRSRPTRRRRGLLVRFGSSSSRATNEDSSSNSRGFAWNRRPRRCATSFTLPMFPL